MRSQGSAGSSRGVHGGGWTLLLLLLLAVRAPQDSRTGSCGSKTLMQQLQGVEQQVQQVAVTQRLKGRIGGPGRATAG